MFEEKECRCCSKPSSKLTKLTTKAKISSASDEGKSYMDMLYELTLGMKRNVGEYDETLFPNMICHFCLKLLQQSYMFLLQIQARHYYFIQDLRCSDVQHNKATEDMENLDEIPFKMPETNVHLESTSHLDIKLEEIEESRNKAEDIKLEEPIDVLCNNPVDVINGDDPSNVPLNVEESRGLDVDVFTESGDERKEILSTTEEESDVESLDEIDVLTEPIAVRCDVCQKIYRDKQALNTHKRYTHMPDEEKIPCPLCNHKTSRPSALKVHMELKHGTKSSEEVSKPLPSENKPYTCDVCERGYRRRDDLSRHIRRKHKNSKEKPAKAKKCEECFLCPYCGQSYNSKKMLDSHLLIHTGERPYPCGICDKSFKRVKDMKTHQLIHSDEKPFQCSDCAKSFKRSDKLKIHMRVHSELRPYKCRECEKTFKYPSVLKTHMYMHTGQTPFACKTCGEAFSLRTSLNNHCLKYGHVNLNMFGENKCRCCTNLSTKLTNLTEIARISGVVNEGKTYMDMLLEICSVIVPNLEEYDETKFPNKICHSCLKLLKLSYKFLLQIQSTYDYFMQCSDSNSFRGTEDMENLYETPVVLIESSASHEFEFELKSEEHVDEDNSGLEEIKLEETIDISNDESFTAAAFISDGPSNVQLNDMEENPDLDDDNKSADSCEERYSIGERAWSASAVETPDEMKMLSEPTVLVCDVCPETFHDKHELYSHKRNSHMSVEQKRKKIPCPLCSYKSSRPQALRCHMELKHGKKSVEAYLEDRPFICDHCGRGFTRRFDMQRHAEKVHAKETTTVDSFIDECPSDVQLKELKAIRDLYVTKLAESCNDSKQEALSSSEEQSDSESLDEPTAFICEICQKVFDDRSSFYSHKRFTHMPDEEKIACPLCDHKTSRSQALKVHMEFKHGKEFVEEYFKPAPLEDKPHKCDMCESSFNRRYDLNRHIQAIHLNPNPKTPGRRKNEETCFLCPHCGQSYSTKRKLRNHLITHSEDRPYSCGVCGKAFKSVRSVKDHQLTHSDIRPYTCSICEKSFKRADKLKTHMLVHSELRPYKCEECGKTFKYSAVLRSHMYKHTGQTPYSCKTCGEEFTSRTFLNNHCSEKGHFM
ncbi:uncharacterized protein [Musca autumnalis]|uniref:uncharacterized protein n=1 Tax=Musca autumnalis TaxID=221902 RepID=UPI003CEF22FD